MLRPSLQAFAAELEKLSAPFVDDAALVEVLQPGDILHTKPRRNDGVLHKLLYKAETALQRTPYTHVGLYLGGNSVIDSGDWRDIAKGNFGVTKVPLQEFKKRYQFKVLRPDVTPEQRRDALTYAKAQVGVPFNVRGLVRFMLPGKTDRPGRAERQSTAESLFCSELVSNAYHDANLVPEKKRRHNHVTPADLANSDRVHEIAEYK